MTHTPASTNRMSLQSLLHQALPALENLPQQLGQLTVCGLTQDSRQVKPGELFVALFGKNHDARDYIDVAAQRGAIAALADAGGQWTGIRQVGGIPVIAIDGLRAALGLLAAAYYGYPSSQLTVIGVTGTNGKTSCTQFIAQLLQNLHVPCGVIGTLGSGVYPRIHDTGFTTPDAIMLQASLADIAAQNAGVVAMEVSSQALHQHRQAGVRFHTALFTNLTRDHLDYHGTMQAYADSKRRLFEHEKLQVGIVNADDSYAAMMLNALPRQARSLTYSVRPEKGDIFARTLEFTSAGFTALVCTPWGDAELTGSLLGAFNFSNVLAALTAVMTLPEHNGSLQQVAAAVSQLRPVNGRMELVGHVDNVAVVVDYAHTPDGLQCALQAARQHTQGQIWCVFGCGGNRDQGKRSLMAEVADELADHIIVTDDNPRLENGDDIVRQILFGFRDPACVCVERDRALAIRAAVTAAQPGDLVLIAGKGHENYQDVGGTKYPFSDAEQVQLAVALRSAASGRQERA